MPGKKTVRLPAAERRQQILDIARSLFVQRGIEHTSMREIAKKAGITATSIYDHFEDKDDLLYEIGQNFFSAFIEHAETELAGLVDPMARFRAMGRLYISFGVAHPEEYRLVFMTPIAGLKRLMMLDGRHAVGADGQPTKGALAYGMLEAHITEMMGKGLIREGNVCTVSEAVWAALHGVVALLITHDHFEFSSPEEMIAMTASIILDGLCPR
ncbi:MAG: TetR/AcrR family transcriptional regulator [Parvibaculaceae bacterium]|nr:TetR/AcrR family transcriptional regulator [Parvibaculaceae bacterium]